jgi:hypothetical protein
VFTPQEAAQYIVKLAREQRISINSLLLQNGLSKKVVDNMKVGKMPSADKLAVIARALETDVFALLGMDSTAEQKNSGSIEPTKDVTDDVINSTQTSIKIGVKSFEERLGQLMDVYNVTNQQLSKKTDIPGEKLPGWQSFLTVLDLESPYTPKRPYDNGTEFSDTELMRIAEAFGITVERLLGRGGITETTCMLCGHELGGRGRATHDDGYAYECLNCGNYFVENSFIDEFMLDGHLREDSKVFAERHLLSGEIRRRYDRKQLTTLDNNCELLSNPLIPHSVIRKLDRLLIYCGEKTSLIGEYIEMKYPAICYSKDKRELSELIKFAVDAEYLERDTTVIPLRDFYKVSLDGYKKYEELEKTTIKSDVAFVAMWFDNSIKHIYEPLIKSVVGWHDFNAVRLDTVEHGNDINYEMIAQIKAARFVVADLTGHRGGVYYEAGFAKGLNKQVVLTCRDDDFDKTHFDLNHTKIIKWCSGNLSEFAYELSMRIDATVDGSKHLSEKERRYYSDILGKRAEEEKAKEYTDGATSRKKDTIEEILLRIENKLSDHDEEFLRLNKNIQENTEQLAALKTTVEEHSKRITDIENAG